jgi:hypothetical protein
MAPPQPLRNLPGPHMHNPLRILLLSAVLSMFTEPNISCLRNNKLPGVVPCGDEIITDVLNHSVILNPGDVVGDFVVVLV